MFLDMILCIVWTEKQRYWNISSKPARVASPGEKECVSLWSKEIKQANKKVKLLFSSIVHCNSSLSMGV